MRALLDEIPMHRMGKPEEMAAMCVFLASDARGVHHRLDVFHRRRA